MSNLLVKDARGCPVGKSESGNLSGRLTAVAGSHCPVLATASPSIRHALTVECAADYVVTYTRQVFDSASPNQYNRVLLKIMPFTTNIGSDFYTVGQTDSSYFPQGRVGLLWGHGPYLNTNPPALRATRAPFGPVCERILNPMHGRRLSFFADRLPTFSNQLIDCWHRKSLRLNGRNNQLYQSTFGMSTDLGVIRLC